MADHQGASRPRPELARRTGATETLERARPDAGVHALAEAPFAQHLTPASVLRLQHHQGNQFVLRLLARPQPQPTAVRVSRPIQRLDARQVTVSAKTMERLRLAQDAIQQVNSEILKFGAGNQADDIRKTKGVSLHRTKILADKKDVDWKVTRDLGADERRVQPEPARREILLKYYGASVCDDYGYATFNYLRQIASGQKITRVSSPALHHAYVIIGDLQADTDAELVVADPWPTSPQACRWMDFFGYHAQRNGLNIKNDMVADGSNIHEEVKASVEILHEAESPENLTSEKQMTNIVGQLNNAKQLKKQVGGAQKIQELQDQLIDSIKFDDAALDAFIAHVATYHKSKRSLQIRQFFGGLKGTDPDTRKTAATSDSKRAKVIKLLLEFAGTEEGMDALVQGYVEQLIATQPDAFVWNNTSTLGGSSQPIFYIKSGWSEKHKAQMRAKFEADLESNKHVSDKAMQTLFPGEPEVT